MNMQSQLKILKLISIHFIVYSLIHTMPVFAQNSFNDRLKLVAEYTVNGVDKYAILKKNFIPYCCDGKIATWYDKNLNGYLSTTKRYPIKLKKGQKFEVIRVREGVFRKRYGKWVAIKSYDYNLPPNGWTDLFFVIVPQNVIELIPYNFYVLKTQTLLFTKNDTLMIIENDINKNISSEKLQPKYIIKNKKRYKLKTNKLYKVSKGELSQINLSVKDILYYEGPEAKASQEEQIAFDNQKNIANIVEKFVNNKIPLHDLDYLKFFNYIVFLVVIILGFFCFFKIYRLIMKNISNSTTSTSNEEFETIPLLISGTIFMVAMSYGLAVSIDAKKSLAPMIVNWLAELILLSISFYFFSKSGLKEYIVYKYSFNYNRKSVASEKKLIFSLIVSTLFVLFVIISMSFFSFYNITIPSLIYLLLTGLYTIQGIGHTQYTEYPNYTGSLDFSNKRVWIKVAPEQIMYVQQKKNEFKLYTSGEDEDVSEKYIYLFSTQSNIFRRELPKTLLDENLNGKLYYRCVIEFDSFAGFPDSLKKEQLEYINSTLRRDESIKNEISLSFKKGKVISDIMVNFQDSIDKFKDPTTTLDGTVPYDIYSKLEKQIYKNIELEIIEKLTNRLEKLSGLIDSFKVTFSIIEHQLYEDKLLKELKDAIELRNRRIAQLAEEERLQQIKIAEEERLLKIKQDQDKIILDAEILKSNVAAYHIERQIVLKSLGDALNNTFVNKSVAGSLEKIFTLLNRQNPVDKRSLENSYIVLDDAKKSLDGISSETTYEKPALTSSEDNIKNISIEIAGLIRNAIKKGSSRDDIMEDVSEEVTFFKEGNIDFDAFFKKLEENCPELKRRELVDKDVLVQIIKETFHELL